MLIVKMFTRQDTEGKRGRIENKSGLVLAYIGPDGQIVDLDGFYATKFLFGANRLSQTTPGEQRDLDTAEGTNQTTQEG